MSREFLKDSTKYFVSLGFSSIATLLAIPLITRLVSTIDYGRYLLVVATIGFLSNLAVGWIGPSVLRFTPTYEREQTQLSFKSTISKLILMSAGTIYLLSNGLIILFPGLVSPDYRQMVPIAGLILVGESLSAVFLCFIRAQRQLNWYILFSAWTSIVRIVMMIFMVVFFKLGVVGLLWGWFVSLMTTVPIMGVVSLRSAPIAILQEPISRKISFEIMRFGLPVAVMALLSWVLSASDRYLIGLFLGNVEVGIYSATYDLTEKSLTQVISLASLAGVPLMFSTWEKEGEARSRELLRRITTYFLTLALPMTLGIIVMAKPIVTILLPIAYHSAFHIMPIVALGVFMWGLMHSYTYGLGLHNRTDLQMYCLFAAGASNITLNVILIPKYGLLAAAYSTLVSYTVAFVAVAWISKRFFAWKFPFRTFLRLLGASLVMGASVYAGLHWMKSVSWLNLLLGISCGILSYGIALVIIVQKEDTALGFFMRIRKGILLFLTRRRTIVPV